MPTVPGVRSQAPGPVTTMTQPPPSEVRPESEPEPAKTAADHIPPTQDELAAQSILQQTVRKRGEMIPGAEPSAEPAPYKFTDDDRDKAAVSRLAKRYNWDTAPLDDALAYLAEIRAECERGGLALERRVSDLKVEVVKCFGCDNMINLSQGRWATSRTRNNFETNIPETAYACSAACGLKLNRDFTHPTRQVAIPVERES